ncbi:MAG TPA: ThiF family adenylyltransferase [Terriglobales bacterium]|nr:ThiF family adenylyltransferase [Terriglobales bacterium]
MSGPRVMVEPLVPWPDERIVSVATDTDMKPELDERYSRQVLFAGIGSEGQQRLLESRIAIVGCGATGSALASLLSRAGVGTLRIIDRDYVEPSNLQRQTLFDEKDAAESVPKAIGAAKKIATFNSQIVVEPKVSDLTPENIEDLLAGGQFILDGTDNFETRYLINDFAVKASLPWIYTAAVGSYAATMNVLPGETACLACIFPETPTGLVETCETAGILNSAVNLVASIAATEAIKLLVGARPQLRRTLLSFDIWRNQRTEISSETSRADCRTCQKQEFVYLAGERRPHITLCGRNSVQIHEHQRPIDLAEMGERLRPHGTVRRSDFILKFSKEPFEMTLFPDGRAIIKGTTDPAVARSLYAKYVGV